MAKCGFPVESGTKHKATCIVWDFICSAGKAEGNILSWEQGENYLLALSWINRVGSTNDSEQGKAKQEPCAGSEDARRPPENVLSYKAV